MVPLPWCMWAHLIRGCRNACPRHSYTYVCPQTHTLTKIYEREREKTNRPSKSQKHNSSELGSNLAYVTYLLYFLKKNVKVETRPYSQGLCFLWGCEVKWSVDMVVCSRTRIAKDSPCFHQMEDKVASLLGGGKKKETAPEEAEFDFFWKGEKNPTNLVFIIFN